MVHGEDGYSQFTVVTAAGISSVSDFANQIEAFLAPYYAANEDYELPVCSVYYAGIHHRAHKGNWDQKGSWCKKQFDPPAVYY